MRFSKYPLFTSIIVNCLIANPINALASSFISAYPTNENKVTMDNGKTQPAINYATVWADKTGATHVGHCQLHGLQYKSYAPPSGPQWIGIAPDKIASVAYAVLPVGYQASWHNSPGPQWVVTLSGRWSVTTTDGSVLEQGPGEFQFNADYHSIPRKDDKRIGHTTRTVGNEPNIQLIIKLKPGADKERTQGACAY